MEIHILFWITENAHEMSFSAIQKLVGPAWQSLSSNVSTATAMIDLVQALQFPGKLLTVIRVGGTAKSCTLDDWNPLNNGINHLSDGAGFRNHPQY